MAAGHGDREGAVAQRRAQLLGREDLRVGIQAPQRPLGVPEVLEGQREPHPTVGLDTDSASMSRSTVRVDTPAPAPAS